jgi:hypothetical protein
MHVAPCLITPTTQPLAAVLALAGHATPAGAIARGRAMIVVGGVRRAASRHGSSGELAVAVCAAPITSPPINTRRTRLER